jgi:nucleoporin POM152
VTYEEHAKLDDGQKLLRRRELNAPQGLATIQLDTSKSGQYEYKFGQLADSNYRQDASTKKNTDLILTQRVHPRPTARFSNPGKTFSFCTTEDPEEDVIPISFTGVPPFELDVDLKFSGSASPESIPLTGIASNQYELKVPRKYLRPGHSHLTIRRVRDGRGCQSKTDTSVPPSRVQISVHDPPEIVSLESKTDFCVGDRLSFRLSGVNPFTVFYTFEGSSRKATSKKTTFRRLAERPGEFVITGVSDSGSNCRFGTTLANTVHPLPTVKMSHGRESYVDIHEGGETELLFEFTGTPPFEFTYTRSENERRGKKGRVLETKTEKTDQMSVRLKASEEGTYEVVAVRDKWCSVSKFAAGEVKRERLLTN